MRLECLHFEISHFSVILLAKKVVFLISSEKDEISSLRPPLENFYVYLWKYPRMVPPGRKISYAHDNYYEMSNVSGC